MHIFMHKLLSKLQIDRTKISSFALATDCDNLDEQEFEIRCANSVEKPGFIWGTMTAS